MTATISSALCLLNASAMAIALFFSSAMVLPAHADGTNRRGHYPTNVVVNCRDGWEYNKQKRVCERKPPGDAAD